MDRESLVYKAKLAEQAERFDEMVQDMYVTTNGMVSELSGGSLGYSGSKVSP